ncbi:helix-turn-helix domain-containing protein [Vagococcus fluvialis]|uniref:helix-turn-helix domain-containing protein n=1 Tax=Vagococcus fluvialis TaxID=2738 RepID=UPI0025885FED|nr:XRE family transcriptional regulator [uncultured Vagococcus sp.]
MLHSEFNGERLKEARLFNQMTISEIADLLGVTKQMVSKYENGKSSPSLDSTFKLVQELKFPREFYYTRDKYSLHTQGTFFRSRYTSTQKEKIPSEYSKKYTAIIRDYLNEFLDFPELDWNLTNKSMSPTEYAEFIRKEWNLEEKPIIDVMNLLEEKGFVVTTVSNQSDKVDAFSSSVMINENKYFVILLEGNSYSFYRQQFSLAHELGHWLMHDGIYNPQELDKESYKEMENEANEFASAFLLPEKSFSNNSKQNLNQIDQYLNLKRYWNVSISMMIMRAKNLGLISTEEYVKLQRQLNYRGWRKEEPLDNIRASKPIALKQAIQLLVENNIIEGYEIPREIMKKYGLALPTRMIEQLTELKRGYLEYSAPQIVSLTALKEKKAK